MSKKPAYYKDALKRFRERRGGSSDELKARHKYMTKLVKEVKKAIEEGASQVPDIAEATGYSKDEVFKAVIILNRYNKLKILKKKTDYPTYGF